MCGSCLRTPHIAKFHLHFQCAVTCYAAIRLAVRGKELVAVSRFATAVVWARVRRVMHAMPVLLMAWGSMPGDSRAADLPPEISGWFTTATPLADGGWEVFETEFGKSFGGGMTAKLPGYPGSCDFTVGPEFRIEFKGDTAWEEPPMLDMFLQMYDEDVAKSETSLPAMVELFRSSNSHVQSVSAVRSEQLDGGTIVSIEYTEDCPKRPHATNTVLNAYARKGATRLDIYLWLSAPLPEARALVVPIIEGFQKVDWVRLAEGATPQ